MPPGAGEGQLRQPGLHHGRQRDLSSAHQRSRRIGNTLIVAADAENGVRGFQEKGGFWRLLLVVAAYLALHLGSGWVAGQFDSGEDGALQPHP